MTDKDLIERLLEDTNMCPAHVAAAAADRIEQLVANNEALVKERDEALEWLSASQGYIADAVFALDKQEKAEANLAVMETLSAHWNARAERLEAALREIADTDPDDGAAWFHDVANAALKGDSK